MKRRYLAFIIVICILLNFSIVLATTDDIQEDEKFKLDDIFDEYILVGLAELYYGSNNLSGNLEVISDTDRFAERLDQGRISFYLKGKIRGRYLLTAWLDTGEEHLDNLFSNLGQRRINPFEKLDPDKYYPVYGDNSKLSTEVNTAGKFYLCLESEEFKALLGNYKLSFLQNNLIDYKRSFYGFNLEYNQQLYGQGLYLETFWQQPFSLHSQDEIETSGGMLYYLRNTDIVIGSEDLRIELRDASSGRIKETVELIPDIDYEINYLQGRVVLNKGIDTLLGTVDGLIEDDNGGDKYFLIADYDYDYDYQDSDNDGYGLETSYQITDNLLVGGTYLKQQDEDGQAYQVSGINIYYTPFADSSLRLESAYSKNVLSGKYTSDDGGLRYKKIPLAGGEGSSAWNLEYQQELKDTEMMANGKLSLYYSNKDRGFSSGSNHIDQVISDYGIKLSGEREKEKIKGSLAYEEIISEDKDTSIYTVNLSRQQTEKLGLELELRNKQETEIEKEYNLTGALGFDYQLAENKKIYGSQQLTIDNRDGMDSNNLTKLGGEIREGKWSFNTEGTTGDRDSLEFGAAYQLNKVSDIYTSIARNFAKSGKTSTETTIGSSSRVNKDTVFYGEHRIDDQAGKREEDNIVGIDYSLSDDWILNFDYSFTQVDREDEITIDRKIIGFASTYGGQDIDFDSRMEYRKDYGDSNLGQFILRSDLNWRYNQEFTLLSEIEYSREKEEEENIYLEGSIGMAYRPIEIDRLNLIGKYTYLKEDNSLRETDHTTEGGETFSEGSGNISDFATEKSQVFSLEAIYDINSCWQLAEKLAYKNGEVKLGIEDNDWVSSETYLWINRLNYKWKIDLDLFTEYRILENKLAQDRKSGFLLGAYKKFPGNVKIGAGYNFTDFNDDLTNLNYEATGWFVNLIKVW